MVDWKYLYRGVDVDTLTHEEALAALKSVIHSLQKEREFRANFTSLNAELEHAKHQFWLGDGWSGRA